MSKKKDITIEIVLVTPAMAAEWLERNVSNRKIRETVVRRYAADVENGNWHLTGDPIKFDRSGNLRDGQHRLTAVVRANKSARMAVAHGVSDDAVTSIDSGCSRTFADFLQFDGVKNSKHIAAVCTALYKFNVTGGATVNHGFMPSRDKLMEIYSAHADEVNASFDFVAPASQKFIPASAVAFCHLLMARKDREQADKFVGQLLSGEGLRKESPVYLLRQRLIDNMNSRPRLDRHVLIYLVLRAWNATRSGERMSRLLVPNDAQYPEIL